MINDIMIIHVSGTSGSGKSYIGALIRKIFAPCELAVVDLDVMLRRAIDAAGNKPNNVAAIQRDVTAQIRDIHRRNPNILITGYSDVVHDKNIHFIDVAADKRYFIDIPFAALLKQFRKRSHNLKSESELRRTAESDKKIYSKHHYTFKSQRDIVMAIITLIGKTSMLPSGCFKRS
jgi:adenylate kinase family enzyme